MKKPKKPQPAKKSELSKPKPVEEPTLGDLRGQIEERLKSIVTGRQVGDVADVVLEVIHEEVYSGPLPHPRHLRAYEDICPGMADRILAMTEKTVDANNAIPEKVIEAQSKYSMLGLLLGFAALIALAVGATICAINDQPEIAGAFLGVGVVGVIGRFIDGKRRSEPPAD